MGAPKGNKNALGNKGGGKKKYPDIKVLLQKTKDYIETCKDEKIELLESVNEKTGHKRFISKLKVKLPTIEGLSLYLDLSDEGISRYSKKSLEFRGLLNRLKKFQAERLINNSLAGNYNALIAKLILAKHGYKDNAEVEHRGKVIILDK